MTSRRSKPMGFTRGPRIADLMTPELESFVDSSIAAERAGDAETALEYHRGIPMFARSAHTAILTRLVELRDDMTPWLWARWAAYQCTRAESPADSDSASITRTACRYVIDLLHPERMRELHDLGKDPVPFVARTVGEDWAYHQLCTFELGGLEAFLEDLATGRLAEEAALARRWTEAQMGGYRWESTTPGEVSVRDLANDEVVDVLDLGGHVGSGDGGWIIGRLVPSGLAPSLMFDTRPLPVGEDTARDVASVVGVSGGWVRELDLAVAARRFDPDSLRSEDRELATDVPGLLLLEAGTRPSALGPTMASLREGRDEVGRAAFRLLRSAADGGLDADRAPYVGAAALDPHGFAEARRVLSASPGAWEQWAELVPDPARSRLLMLSAGEKAAA